MFSFGYPFGYEYSRPKSYGLFNDDYYYPFSTVPREQPSLFRSSSFRQQPSRCYPSSFNQPSYRTTRQQSSDEDDEYDPFLDLFSLSNRGSKKLNNQRSKTNESKPCNQSTNKQNDVHDDNRQSVKPTSQQQHQSPAKQLDRELDSQRWDNDDQIEFRFPNYKCTEPSKIAVTVSKDGYIVLRTGDGYVWKSRVPDDADVSRASCTCSNQLLTLKLPKVKVDRMEVEPKSGEEKKVQQSTNDTTVQSKIDRMEIEPKSVEEKKVQQSTNDTTVQSKVEDKKEEETEEYDPYAPIVEDVIEDDIY